ncbi:flagellar hook-length control protein FliK [Clostridium paraputrificum]|uniref:flagellar hook-length control protein FliK n=1 Tax=Clostridium TaxID=1485 RepID=UPI0006C45830|nr:MULTISPECIES: flagellar hook-length control protein FliK [Clostridium]MDB2109003.1 flagellar hook-length control protein FliK [Clostridium paraputrificum]MDU4144426.1 flagellar hook-length control protein FliK [Clostridium sp.]CUN86574.1 putative flagellar hook-length control protein FliK [Clostridium paraputrificum]CUP90570.1 putative flagellar hook-length control protein FliK [Clostridium paraputrificum]
MIQGINLDLIKMVNKPTDNTLPKDVKEDKSFKSVLDNEKNNITKKDVDEVIDVMDEEVEEIPENLMEQLSLIISLLPSIVEKLPNESINLEKVVESINNTFIKETDFVIDLGENLIVNDKNNLKDIQSILNEFVRVLDEDIMPNLDNQVLKEDLSKLENEIEVFNNILSSNIPNSDEKSVVGLKSIIKEKINVAESNSNIVVDKEIEDEVTHIPVVEEEASDNGSEFSKKSFDNEEKVLNSIINDGEDKKVTTKFTLMSNNISSSNVEKVEVPKVINRGNMVEDIVKSVKYMTSNNIKELVVRINPKDLGEVAIRIVQEDGIMKANLKASSKETYSILSQNLGDIKRYLGEQNIKIQQVDISLYEDTTYFKEEFQGQAFNQDRREKQPFNKEIEVNSSLIEDEFEENEVDMLSNINMLA